MIPTQPIGITRPERLRLGPPRRVAELVLSWLRSHRPEAADPWRGRVLPARAPWHADRVAGGVRADRQPVPRWHAALAADNHIPVVRFRREDRKAEVMRPYLDRAARTGRLQVAAIGVAQEFARCGPPAGATPTRPNRRSSFTKQQRRVTVFYEYVWDDDFGPRSSSSAPGSPTRSRSPVNGHEWAKRQAAKAGIGLTELSNGFAACQDPPPCKRSVTGSAPARSGGSSNAGPRGYRCRFRPPTATAGTGGT
jgi:hypothetical protein